MTLSGALIFKLLAPESLYTFKNYEGPKGLMWLYLSILTTLEIGTKKFETFNLKNNCNKHFLMQNNYIPHPPPKKRLLVRVKLFYTLNLF